MKDVEENKVTLSNAGWADSISKILKTKKPKGKKTIVLSKAKKINEIKKNKVKFAGFEVASADGTFKKETVEMDDEEKECLRKKQRRLPRIRVKPNILDSDREREFRKVATKGTLQFFNAVIAHQKIVSKKLEEAGPLEVRKEMVLKSIDKRAFLNVLMGKKSHVDKTSAGGEGQDQKENGTWNVLRDDFMIGAKMKDWDKNIEDN